MNNWKSHESSLLPIQMTRELQVRVHVLHRRRQRRRKRHVHFGLHQHKRPDVIDDALVDPEEVLVRDLVRWLQLPLHDRQHAVDRLQHAAQPADYRSDVPSAPTRNGERLHDAIQLADDCVQKRLEKHRIDATDVFDLDRQLRQHVVRQEDFRRSVEDLDINKAESLPVCG